MGLSCGIVGLPNAGKSTIFNALTSSNVPAESYPFCTKDHHTAVAEVPDKRLQDIGRIFGVTNITPTHIEFVDIAGLVKNAHSGEGLGNRFLHYISEVDAILHVVRCFEDGEVAHVEGRVDPVGDVEIINTELLLADLEKAERQIQKHVKVATTGDKEAKRLVEVLTKIRDGLTRGTFARQLGLEADEIELVKDLFFLTLKPVLYVANIGEADIKDPGPNLTELKRYLGQKGEPLIEIAGKLEAELTEFGEEDRASLLKDVGLAESGLTRLVRKGYELLGLITFFTKERGDVRAWAIKHGTKAPQAAGKIHTDFERGFIKAEVFTYEELMRFQSEDELRKRGIVRTEGKDYVVQDGDIIQFKFNV